MMHRCYPALLHTAIGLLGTLSAASGAPLTFNTALPVGKGEFVFREQFVFIKSGDDPGPADREVEVLGAISVLGYGVNENLALFGVLPYLDKDLEVTPDGEHITRETNGIGDFTAFGRYTVFRDDAPGRTFRIAPFAGLKTPTGEDDERDRFGRLPPPIQLGSGSWDPFAGVVATYQTLAFQIDVQASYEIATEANDFEFGDVARLDGSLQYRLWPRKLSGGVPGFFYGILEANLVYQDENEINGIEDPDSGGLTLFLIPGLQYVTRRWIVEGGVQAPVVQDLNGEALENDFVVRAGFRFNF